MPASSRYISPKPRCAAKRACRSTALSWWHSYGANDRPRTLKRLAGCLYPLVRQSRLDAASASARIVGQGRGRTLGAADRTDRRRQDAGGIFTESRGAERQLPPPLAGEGWGGG